jgi:hypothetical protein
MLLYSFHGKDEESPSSSSSPKHPEDASEQSRTVPAADVDLSSRERGFGYTENQETQNQHKCILIEDSKSELFDNLFSCFILHFLCCSLSISIYCPHSEVLIRNERLCQQHFVFTMSAFYHLV